MTPAIVTIGNFDGVHRGHQYMLHEVVERARSLGLRSYAITFYPHPQAVLRPEQRPWYLADTEEKVCLIQAAGIDDVWVCPFTRELSQLTPEAFMRLVAERQPIRELWIGADFALGRGRSGTVSVLAEIGSADGWGLHVVPPFRLEGQVVGSTGIRNLLAAGEVERANSLLGRPFALAGDLASTDGAQVLRVSGERAVPAAGLYAARLVVHGAPREVVADVQPGRSEGPLEPHSLQLAPLDETRRLPASGTRATVEFLARIRGRDEGRRDQQPNEEDRQRAHTLLAQTLQLGAE